MKNKNLEQLFILNQMLKIFCISNGWSGSDIILYAELTENW